MSTLKKISEYDKKLKNWFLSFKKQSLGDTQMKKSTYATLQKIFVYSFLGIIFLFYTIFSILLPGKTEIELLSQNISVTSKTLYGDPDKNILGLSSEAKSLQEKAKAEEKKFKDDLEGYFEKYEEALPKNINVYDIATYLEDYTITMHGKNHEIIMKNISFGKEEEISIEPKDFKQTVFSPIPYESLLDIFPDGNFLEAFIERSQNMYIFKSGLTNESFAQIENANTRKQLLSLWQETPKVTIPAKFKRLPLMVSLDATSKALDTFINFIYHSGNTDFFQFKGKTVPLMSIESLSLPVKTSEEENKIESYTIRMYAYFQAS